ncbi:MAG: DUF7402 domain-containing protein [Thermoguttaceae bacterium]
MSLFRSVRTAFVAGLLFLFFASAASADPWGERDLEKGFRDWLGADWILQDGGNPGTIFASDDSWDQEIAVIRRAAEELAEYNRPLAEEKIAAAEELAVAKVPARDLRWKEIYLAICWQRRRYRLETPVEETPVIVFTKHYVMGASHYAYTEDVSDEEFKDISIDRKPGGQLCTLTVNKDGTTETKVLYEVSDGSIRDPDVSYDGKRIVFSMRTSFTEDDYHLYEYSVETGQVRQLTFGLGVADIEPAYMPNGDIVFGSTRCIQLTDCWWTEVSNIFMCDGDGRFLRRITYDQVTVNYPKPLADGRILYTRWDYNDRNHTFPQPLFVMNSDGTAQTEFYGNNSYFPTSILHARGIPNSGSKAVGIAAGHHTYQHGKLIMIDRTKGTQENEGATLIAPVRETPADRIDVYGQDGELFAYPYPLNDSEFLVTYTPLGRSDWYKTPFGVYWFDIDGRRELLAFDPAISCNQPVPLNPREVPPSRPSDVDYSKSTGRYYVQNVYEGPGLNGIEQGTIKSIRIVSLLYRPCGLGHNWNWGEIVSSNVSTPVSINGTWDAKKVIGEVPVEADGSAYFEVPARTPVYFQLLDENHDTVQTMRSWSTLQPGELFGCVGCHEPKDSIIANTSGQTTDALKKPVAIPQNFYEPGPGYRQNDGFSYVRDIQPIFDRNCVSCHDGGESAPAPNLTADYAASLDDEMKGKRDFSESYVQLVDAGNKEKKYIDWPDIHSPPHLMKAPVAGAANSPMMKLLRERTGSHSGVILSETDLRKIALWIDLFVPYCGSYDEANLWNKDEKSLYEFYVKKREASEEVERVNIAKLVEVAAGGALPDVSEFPRFAFGGVGLKAKYRSDWIAREIPATTRKSGEENFYRNLALNPNDVQGTEPVAYPHAWTNSESGYLRKNSAAAAIDGLASQGEAAWRPNCRRDAFLQIDLGHEAQVDRIDIVFDLDEEGSDVWTSGTLRFSDGSSVDVTFDRTSEKQTISFEKHVTDSVRLTNLRSESLASPKGIAELEVWGVSL